MVERRRVQARELVRGVEAERVADRGGVERAQLGGAPRRAVRAAWAVSRCVSASVVVASSPNQPEPKLIASRIST